MNQLSTQNTTIISINEYVEITSQMQRLQGQIIELQKQLKDKKISNTKASANLQTIIVFSKGAARYIQLPQIIMMQSDSNYTTIYLTDSTQIFTSKTLKYWGEKIKGNHDFIRPHRSFIVNTTHILSYQASSKKLELACGYIASVSRTFKFCKHS